MKLSGRAAIVTGGANGIGRATVRLLAGEGASVAIADVDDSRMESLVAELPAAGGRVLPIHCDLTSPASVQATVEQAVAAFGRLDVLVNCAGGSGMSPFYKSAAGKAQFWSEDVPVAEWDNTLDLNLKAVFLGCKYAIPVMKKQGSGKIVNFSSIGADIGRSDGTFAYVAYAAAKAGVTGLTRHLATEVGPFGITVNCVCPGSVLSERMLARYAEDPAWKESVEKATKVTTPLQRSGLPEELAEAVLFLASDSASFVNGVTLDVNGGRYMR
ncbi:MAG: SDR family NAD(P)-dependent oxidoreductase [Chloroflexota bacterium]